MNKPHEQSKINSGLKFNFFGGGATIERFYIICWGYKDERLKSMNESMMQIFEENVPTK